MNLKDKTIAELKKSCSYEHWSNGPVNAGPLLEKYGKGCEYSIRPKEWKVIENDSGIVVHWICQETPVKSAVDMIEEAIKNVGPASGDLFLIKVEDRWYDEREERLVEW
jgi:hypothetical protein